MVKRDRLLIALFFFIAAVSMVSFLLYKYSTYKYSASAMLPERTYTIMNDKVYIVAAVDHVNEDEGSSRSEFEFTLSVKKGTACYRYESVLRLE